MPYIDQSPAHDRFAAYQITDLDALYNSPIWGDYLADQQAARDFQREQLGQQRDIAMAEIGQRAAATRSSASSARYSANAQLAAAKLAHKAKMFELEKIGIPRLELEREDVRGRLRIAEMAQRLNEQELGARVVETAAKMGGPGDWVQAWNYARGISQTQIPEYLKLLTTGGNTYELGGGVGTPTPQSYGGIISSLSGGAGAVGQSAASPGGQTVGGRDWAAINSMADTLIRDPGQIALGGLEGLSNDELQGLGSIIRARGGSNATFLDQYRRSRFGLNEGSALAAA